MTAEQVARFVLSDGQDPELRKLADREADSHFQAAMRDPAFKARWDAHLREFADEIDQRIAASVLRELNMK